MRSIVQRLFLVLAVAVPMAALAAPAQAEPKTIFYNLTTDDSWRAGMALGQATKAMENDYNIILLLNVRGVLLAAKEPVEGYDKVDPKIHQMLENLITKGARVMICPMCMNKVGLKDDDLIHGILPGGPDNVFPAMTAPNTVVVSY